MPSASVSKQNTNRVYCAFLMLAAAVFVIITVAALYVRIQLTRENDELLYLNTQLEALDDENRKLVIEISSLYTLEDIESCANNELGMLSEDKAENFEIKVNKENKAVIPNKEEDKDLPDNSWISSVSNIFQKEK